MKCAPSADGAHDFFSVYPQQFESGGDERELALLVLSDLSALLPVQADFRERTLFGVVRDPDDSVMLRDRVDDAEVLDAVFILEERNDRLA